jgi:uncharacterized membrane protein
MMSKDDKYKDPDLPNGAEPFPKLFKRRFTRGLAALLPTLLTLALLAWAYNLVDNLVGRHINSGLMVLLSQTGSPNKGHWAWMDIDVDGEDAKYRDAITYGQPIDDFDPHGRRLTVEYKTLKALPPTNKQDRADYERLRSKTLWTIAFKKYRLHLVGFVIAVIMCYFIGVFLASFFGRSVWRLAEQLLARTPLVRAIYPNIKQVTDFLIGDQKLDFKGIVAVEYPRKGLWSLGLVTGSAMKKVAERSTNELISVFIPSSPTPFTGYVVQLPREETIELPISIDEALRYAMSGGVIKPTNQRIEGQTSPGELVVEPGPDLPRTKPKAASLTDGT